MDAGRSQTKRFRFPGYDGELPKASRSLRGRGDCQRNLLKSSKDMTVFELLATVAGQILQERESHAVESNDEAEKKVAGVHQSRPPEDCKEITDGTNRNLASASGTNHHSYSKSEAVDKKLKTPAQESVRESNIANVLVDKYEEGASNRAVNGNESVVAGIGNRENGSTDMQAHSEGHESDNTNYSHRNATAEGSCMTARDSSLIDEIPPFLSSGSSEDAPISVHKDTCSDTRLEFRQEIARSKAADDDDNFSGTIASETTSPPKIARPLKIMQVQQPHVRNDGVAGLKRKSWEEDDVAEKCNSRSSQYAPRQPEEKKQRVACGSSNLCGSLNNSSTMKFSDSDAKDASDAASSPISKAWRNLKKNSQESQDADPSPVKVNITSFAVPELSIDLPETATIANLKRAVMEAAINLLGGGLHVHVLHQGERVYDESTTLVQMGISCQERADALTFMLEPNQIGSTPSNTQDHPVPLSSVQPQPTAWYPFPSMGYDMQGNKVVNGRSCMHVAIDSLDYQAKQEECGVVNQQGRTMPSPQCLHHTPVPAMSGALILHPGLKSNETMDIVKVQTNLQTTGVGKRRARRPFTVAEVEALVQAVELLGTGRWREVKQQAFDHARHRTYVDLKDKWKTLVHTAHIAPHQRRGEPVPQELLDRVLKAHTYWAEQQAKQQDDIRT